MVTTQEKAPRDRDFNLSNCGLGGDHQGFDTLALQAGTYKGLVRLLLGLEDPRILIWDLQRALKL
ncbi:MAG: hypothetical protein ABR555_15685 [Pyrinomonadaceae bacterium]